MANEVPLPQMAGLTFRYPRVAEDCPAIAAVQNASLAADGVEETTSEDEIAEDFNHATNWDPAADFVLVEAAGQVIGFAKVYWRLTDQGGRVYWQSGHIVLQWRRKGLGRVLLHYTEARAAAHARLHPIAGPSFLCGVVEDTASGKLALFESQHYPPTRYFCFMSCKELQRLPAAPLPIGLELRPAQPGDRRAIWNAKEEAFRDHWGASPKTEADYLRWRDDPRQQPDLWQVVWDTARNEVAAVSLNQIIAQDNDRFGFKRGWISGLGVRRSFRNRGIARSMLVSGMRALREQGMTEVVLGVDADNPNKVVALYESVGFKILNKDAVYQKPLAL